MVVFPIAVDIKRFSDSGWSKKKGKRTQNIQNKLKKETSIEI